MNTSQSQKEVAAARRLMPPAAAAEYLGGLVVGTLAKWRHFGTGPAFVRIGSRIYYDQTDLDRFIDERRRTSTSEAA
jgi:Helix-turn-helix domain